MKFEHEDDDYKEYMKWLDEKPTVNPWDIFGGILYIIAWIIIILLGISG